MVNAFRQTICINSFKVRLQTILKRHVYVPVNKHFGGNYKHIVDLVFSYFIMTFMKIMKQVDQSKLILLRIKQNIIYIL